VRRPADHGPKAWQQVLDRGYEGLIAKDPQSPYVGGRKLVAKGQGAALPRG